MALATICLSGPAFGAGVDCARTTNWREGVICQTPSLSALDRQLEQVYAQKRAMLSPHGAELLRTSQQSWTDYIETLCAPQHAPADDTPPSPASCLENNYEQRLKQLAMVAYRSGPFVFNRVDQFAAELDDKSDYSGHLRVFYVQHLAFPQIDATDPATAAWNRAHDSGSISHYTNCDGAGDQDTDYEIGYATKDAISLEQTISTYCHGTPHGFWTYRTENRSFDHPDQKIVPAAIFSDGYEPKLKQLFWRALAAKGWAPPENQAESIKTEIESIVVEPSRWFFTEDGLRVDFDTYEAGCYSCNPGPTTVPWEALTPLLAPGSPFHAGSPHPEK